MLVGFHGQLGSGKDTCADRVFGMYPDLEHHRVTFADPIKESAAAAIGVSVSTLNKFKNDPNVWIAFGTNYEELGFIPTKHLTVREYIQRYGTEAHRELPYFGDNFWVKAALPDDYDHSNRLAIATDVRFENERDQVQKLGGVVVRVRGITDDPTSSHATEQYLEGCDFEVDNRRRDDNFYHLDLQLNAILEEIT